MARDRGWEFLFGGRRESGSFRDDEGNEGYIYSDGSGYFHGVDGSDGYIYTDGSGYYRGGDGSDGYKYSDGSGYFRGGSRNVDAYQYSDGSGYYEDDENFREDYDSTDELEESEDDNESGGEYSGGYSYNVSERKRFSVGGDDDTMNWPRAIVILVSLLILFGFSWYGFHRMEQYAERERQEHIARNELELPISAKELKGRNYQDVVFIFENAGFSNFEFVVEDDIVTGWIWEDGEVETVEVNGDKKFEKGDWQHKDSTIRITYHTKKNKN